MFSWKWGVGEEGCRSGEVALTMYAHVSKFKNDKRKKGKIITKEIPKKSKGSLRNI
jgi:hypothetical protein